MRFNEPVKAEQERLSEFKVLVKFKTDKFLLKRLSIIDSDTRHRLMYNILPGDK